MHPHVVGINVVDCKIDGLAESEPHAVGGKEENPVVNDPGRGKQLIDLVNRENVGDSPDLWLSDERNMLPCLLQNMGVEELQAIEIKLDRIP